MEIVGWIFVGMILGVGVMAMATRGLHESRQDRQIQVALWCRMAFGEEQTSNVSQLGLRLLEEAAEAAQAAGVPREKADLLIDYVWKRVPGELDQEIGGVGLCVLALADAAGLDADDMELTEVNRVMSKDPKYFAMRNQAKNDAGLLVEKSVE